MYSGMPWCTPDTCDSLLLMLMLSPKSPTLARQPRSLCACSDVLPPELPVGVRNGPEAPLLLMPDSVLLLDESVLLKGRILRRPENPRPQPSALRALSITLSDLRSPWMMSLVWM